MQLVGWGRNGGQLAFLADSRASTVLAAVAAHPTQPMIRLLHRCLFPPLGTVVNNLTVQLMVRDALSRGLDSAAQADASLLARAALEISQMPDGPRRMMRGVLLEATVETLCRKRSGRVHPEALFDGLDPTGHPNGRAIRGIDVAVDDPHLELYECKVKVLDLAQSDVDLLQDVAEAAAADGRQCTAAIAGFYRNSALSAVLRTLAVRLPIYSSDLDDLDGLANGRATTQVA